MEQTTQKTALLVMDMQSAIVGMVPDSAKGVVDKVAQAIAHARETKTPVIYVIIGFRADAPEVSPNNKIFSGLKERMAGVKPEDFLAIAPAVAPQEGEIIVTKRRVSAFTGSDLEVILRAQGIQHIILTGIATSGVVLSTTREASDKDFRITVLADACADRDEEVHRVLTTKVFPHQADVIDVENWIKA